jgi:hypothetical protein
MPIDKQRPSAIASAAEQDVPLLTSVDQPGLVPVGSPDSAKTPIVGAAAAAATLELKPVSADGNPSTIELAQLAAPSMRVGDSPAYVSQISDGVRTAYIGQLELSGRGQRLAFRSGQNVLGEVEYNNAGGELSVHVGQVLDLFEDRMDPVRFAQLRSSPASHEFVSLERLRSLGVPIEYDAAYDELVLHADHG